MKKPNLILPIVLALFIARCFCAQDMNSHDLPTNNAFPEHSNDLCFDLVAPAIECIEKYSEKRDNYIRKFRTKPQPKDSYFTLYFNKNGVWNSIRESGQYKPAQLGVASINMCDEETTLSYKFSDNSGYNFAINKTSINFNAIESDPFRAIHQPSSLGLYLAVKYCSAPFICKVIQEISKKNITQNPCDPILDYWFHGARTPGTMHSTLPSIYDFTRPLTYYFTLLHASALRFAQRKDSPSKSIIIELIKAGASLTNKDFLRSPSDDIIIGSDPDYNGNTPLDLLTKSELQLLVQGECNYIESAYTNLRHCAALILRRRDQKSYASGLPTELLVKIMNHAIGTALPAHNYKKILDEVHYTYEDANSNLGDEA